MEACGNRGLVVDKEYPLVIELFGGTIEKKVQIFDKIKEKGREKHENAKRILYIVKVHMRQSRTRDEVTNIKNKAYRFSDTGAHGIGIFQHILPKC